MEIIVEPSVIGGKLTSISQNMPEINSFIGNPPPELSTSDPNYWNSNFKTISGDLHSTSSLSFLSVFSGSLDASSKIFSSELNIWKNIPITCNNDINYVTYGFGFRVLVAVQTLKSDIHLDLQSVSSAVDLGIATASFEIKTLGLSGPRIAQALIESVGTSGILGPTVVWRLLSIVHSLLANYKNPTKTDSTDVNIPSLQMDEFRPVPIRVGLKNMPGTTIKRVQSFLFALKSIAAQVKLSEAVMVANQTPDRFDMNEIKRVYLNTGINNNLPDSYQQNRAINLLNGSY